MLKKTSILVYALVLTGIVLFLLPAIPGFWLSVGKPIKIPLTRGDFTVLQFPPTRLPVKAVILFASGDGGWERLEEAVGQALQNAGYEVIGIDCEKYAATTYDLDTLQTDFRAIAQVALAPYGTHRPPLIIGGYSMGAAQAIAVCGGPNPPEGVCGLLLMDPMSRGRYGLQTSDKMDVLPTGPGTFSTSNFASTIRNLRVVQWHADEDEIDSFSWLDFLTVEHQQFDFPNTGHDYTNNRDSFLHQFVDSVTWILEQPQRPGKRP